MKPSDYSRWQRRGTTTQRGLGSQHQRLKPQLLAALVDGTACMERPNGRKKPPCGRPMIHPKRCPYPPDGTDGRCFACRLDLCHGVARALGGTGGDSRLGHARCNRAAGAHLKNALTRTRRPRRQAPVW